MIIDRMTTLIQKTLNLSYKNLDSSLRASLLGLRNELQKEMESRGLRFTMVDFSALIEEHSPESSRFILGFMLNFLRPFSAGMGFRVTRISDTQIEIIVPWKFRNRSDRGHLHEASLLPAALEAAQIFWQRHIDVPIQILLQSETTRWQQQMSEDARVRLEVSPPNREFVVSQLREQAQQLVDMKFQVYGGADRLTAELDLQVLIKRDLTLNSPPAN